MEDGGTGRMGVLSGGPGPAFRQTPIFQVSFFGHCGIRLDPGKNKNMLNQGLPGTNSRFRV